MDLYCGPCLLDRTWKKAHTVSAAVAMCYEHFVVNAGGEDDEVNATLIELEAHKPN